MTANGRTAAWIGLTIALTVAPAALTRAGNARSVPTPAGGSAAVALLPTTCDSAGLLASGTIATVAGNGTAGHSGDGGPATDAAIEPGFGTIAFDAEGALLFAEIDARDVRRIGSDGIITTVAGPETGAPFEAPAGVAVDAAENILVADFGAGRIWRIDAGGAITSIAGIGVSGSSGDDGPATAAQMGPSGIAIGPRGDLYFDDLNRYRSIDPDGVVHAFAGTGTPGFSGDGGPATAAMFSADVVGVAADGDGNVYLGDRYNHRVRKVDPEGIVTTVAGSGAGGYSGDGGRATEAALGTPHGVAIGADGSFYLTDDYSSSTIRKVDSDGVISTVAGTQIEGFSGDCGPATLAQLDRPDMVAVHDGVLYIVDNGNNRIRMVVP